MVNRYAIIAGGVVQNVALAEPAFAAEQGWVEAPPSVGPGWGYAGGVFTPPEPTPPDLETFRVAVQAHIDATARSRGYENGFALAGYVTSTVAPWRAEAEAFVAWRDQVWLAVFELLAQVQAGDIPPPASPEALIAELPTIDW
jgi:hypothetical protein